MKCDNDAFGACPEDEIAAILRKLANRVESNLAAGTPIELPIKDANGNTVGNAEYVVPPAERLTA